MGYCSCCKRWRSRSALNGRKHMRKGRLNSPSHLLLLSSQGDLSKPETIPPALVGVHTIIDCATGRPEEPILSVSTLPVAHRTQMRVAVGMRGRPELNLCMACQMQLATPCQEVQLVCIQPQQCRGPRLQLWRVRLKVLAFSIPIAHGYGCVTGPCRAGAGGLERQGGSD